MNPGTPEKCDTLVSVNAHALTWGAPMKALTASARITTEFLMIAVRSASGKARGQFMRGEWLRARGSTVEHVCTDTLMWF